MGIIGIQQHYHANLIINASLELCIIKHQFFYYYYIISNKFLNRKNALDIAFLIAKNVTVIIPKDVMNARMDLLGLLEIKLALIQLVYANLGITGIQQYKNARNA